MEMSLCLWLTLRGFGYALRVNLNYISDIISILGPEFVHHNSRQLTRVYPSGFRTDSSNFNPQEMWNTGCQIGDCNWTTDLTLSQAAIYNYFL